MTTRTIQRLATAFVVLLLAACDATPSTGAARDAVPELVAVEAVRIGSLDDPEYAFALPVAMAVAEDGRLVSGHPQTPAVRVFSPDGRALGVLGRGGEGPGEYQGVSAISIEGDSVWVYDSRAYRFTAFDIDSGEVLGTVSIPVGVSTFDERAVRPHQRLGPGRYVGAPSTPSRDVASGDITDYQPLLLDGQGAVTDTLPPVAIGNNQLAIDFEGGGGMYTRQPFGDGPLYFVLPDESLLRLDRAVPADGAYRPLSLVLLSTEGDTVWSRDLAFEPTPISPSVADSIVDVIIPEESPFGRPRGPLLEAARKSLYLPAYQPGANTMLMDSDGRAWIRAVAVDDGRARWWVVGPDGEVLGRVPLPAEYILRTARGSRVWGVELDDLDVPYIVGFDVAFR